MKYFTHSPRCRKEAKMDFSKITCLFCRRILFFFLWNLKKLKEAKYDKKHTGVEFLQIITRKVTENYSQIVVRIRHGRPVPQGCFQRLFRFFHSSL